MKEKDTLLSAISSVIKERRQVLLIPQSELATRSGLHRSYIIDIEHGERNISITNLNKLARALGSKPSELVAVVEKRLGTKKSKKR